MDLFSLHKDKNKNVFVFLIYSLFKAPSNLSLSVLLLGLSLKILLTEPYSRTLTLTPNPNDPRTLILHITLTNIALQTVNSAYVPSMFSVYHPLSRFIILHRTIAAGEALSYDYQFDTNEEDIFKCYCQAYNCRGTMAPRKKMNKVI